MQFNGFKRAMALVMVLLIGGCAACTLPLPQATATPTVTPTINPTPSSPTVSPTPSPDQSAKPGTSPSPKPGTSPTPGAEAKVMYAIKCNQFVSLRATAQLLSTTLEKLPNGEQVEWLGYEGLFIKVKSKSGKTGYIHAGYAQRVDEDAQLKALTTLKGDGTNYGYEPLKADIAKLKSKYGSKLTVKTVGKSADGRDIVLCIVGSDKAKHKVLITASIHGREYMTSFLVMKQMEQYLALLSGSNASKYQEVAFYFMPMLNPDGVEIVLRGAAGIKKKSLRETVAAILTREKVSQLLWKSNARGVDLNRNFPQDWDKLSNEGPNYMRYRGDAAMSESETKAVIDVIADNAFDATVSYHAMGSLQYWQYKQKGALLTRTRSLATAVYNVTGYPLANGAEESITEGGGLRDYALMQRNIPSITIEVGAMAAPMEAYEWPCIWHRNAGVMQALYEYCTK